MVNGGSDGAFEAGEREGSGMDVECLELERGIYMGRKGREKD